MADLMALDVHHRELFSDERGAGLRVTWHPDREFIVLSIWRASACVGTFRLSQKDAARLGEWLLATPAEAALAEADASDEPGAA